MIKTNAMRLLEKAKITFRTVAYEVDENDLSGIHVAVQLKQPPEQIFKTLVVKGDKTGYFVCCIPVDKELDLKKAARLSGNKSAEMIPLKDLQKVTGYIRGGCSPIGMKKQFPTYIHQTAVEWEEIAVSAGIRGMQILLPPKALAEYIKSSFHDMVKI